MTIRSGIALTFVLFLSVSLSAQQPGAQQIALDPTTSMAYDMARVAASVQTMTKTLKDFVDKFAKAEGVALSERQAKLVVGMQILVQAEQRLAVQQKYQIELVEKESQIRSRISQIDIDADQQALERSVAFEGGTRTPEVKEIRRRTLMAERSSLQNVLQQVQSNLQDSNVSIREAQSLVQRLRRAFLPQVERELSEQ